MSDTFVRRLEPRQRFLFQRLDFSGRCLLLNIALRNDRDVTLMSLPDVNRDEPLQSVFESCLRAKEKNAAWNFVDCCMQRHVGGTAICI